MNSLPYLPAFIGQRRQYESVPLFGARFRSQHFPRALKREERAKEEGERLHVSLSPPRFISTVPCDDVSNNGDLKRHELIVSLDVPRGVPRNCIAFRIAPFVAALVVACRS